MSRLIRIVQWLVIMVVTPAFSATYYPFAINSDALTGALDQSQLNQPLTAADRLFVRDGRFHRVGPDLKANTSDDERVRLFGINLSFAANFPTETDAVRIARRLRRLGFNAVRLHHLDTAPDRHPGAARSVLTQGRFPTFNPRALDRLRTLIDALSAEGIYINLNLHVGYRFRPREDDVPALPNGPEPLPMASPVHLFHPRLIERQAQYNRELIRQLGLRNQPALAMVELNNESSLAHSWQHWQVEHWEEVIGTHGPYADELQRQWHNWLEQKYGGIAQACQRWGGCQQGEAPSLITPRATLILGNRRINTLSERISDAWRSTRSQLGFPDTAARTVDKPALIDFMAFIADTDRHYFESMRKVVHEALDALVPVSGTQTSFGAPLTFDALEKMDFLDEHFYVDHYSFPGKSWDQNNWKIRNTSLSGGELTKLLAQGFYRDIRKPFVLSEYNQPFPNAYRAEMLPLLASIAAFQDWDGLFFYDYADGDRWSGAPSSFNLDGDLSHLAVVGQAARIFRQPLIMPAAQVRAVTLDRSTRLDLATRRSSQALRDYAARQAAVPPETALTAQIGIDPRGSLPAPQRPSVSDRPLLAQHGATLTLARRGVIGLFGTPAPGQVLESGFAQIKLAPRSRGFVTALLTAQDGASGDQANHWLLSLPGDVRGSQPGIVPRRPKQLVKYGTEPDGWTLEADAGQSGSPSGSRDAMPPLWMERVECTLSLKIAAASVTVFPLDDKGQRLPPLPARDVRINPGHVDIMLQTDGQSLSPWYEIIIRREGTNDLPRSSGQRH